MGPAEMRRLTSAVEERILDAWLRFVELVRRANPIATIEQRLVVKDPTVALVGLDDAAALFADEVIDAYQAAGRATARWASRQVAKHAGPHVAKKNIAFDAEDPAVVRWAEQNRLDLIREITSGQRALIRDALVEGARTGVNPRETARGIRDLIGLTDAQARIVANYRRELERGQLSAAMQRELRNGRYDRALEAAIRDGKAIPQDRIDAMVEAYERNWIAYRAEAIARSEGNRVAHQASEETYRQAIDRGDLEAEQIERTWNHSPGAKNQKNARDFHLSMQGQTRGYGEPFVSGRGTKLMYPLDPSAPAEETIHCRCSVSTRIKPPTRRATPRPAPAAVVFQPPQIAPPVPSAAPAARPPGPKQPAIATMPVVGEKKLGGGINVSKVIKFEDGSSAVWKPVTGEKINEDDPDFPFPGVERGTLHKREVAAYQVSLDLGLDIVPETAIRVHDGVEGSVQRFMRGTVAWKYKGPTMDQESVEQLRTLDFVAGNLDRHGGNLMIDKSGRAIAIDNGVAFPNGRGGLIQPEITTVPFAGLDLLPKTLERIANIDLEKIAATMRRNGLGSEAVRHALYRAQLLKERPMLIKSRIGPMGAQDDIFVREALNAENLVSPAGKALADAIVGAP